MTTEVYNQINKLRLKNIINKTWTEITAQKHHDFRKKLAQIILISGAAMGGIWLSFVMMWTGKEILLESGVSVILIARAAGVIACLGGVCALRLTVLECSGALKNLYRNKKQEVKKNEVTE